jgi:hypothetical protein
MGVDMSSLLQASPRTCIALPPMSCLSPILGLASILATSIIDWDNHRSAPSCWLHTCLFNHNTARCCMQSLGNLQDMLVQASNRSMIIVSEGVCSLPCVPQTKHMFDYN